MLLDSRVHQHTSVPLSRFLSLSLSLSLSAQSSCTLFYPLYADLCGYGYRQLCGNHVPGSLPGLETQVDQVQQVSRGSGSGSALVRWRGVV